MFVLSRAPARRQATIALAGLAAGVIPLALVVHIAVELIVAAPPPADFIVRHLYMVPLALVALGAFAGTLGIGAPRTEFVRRAALARARILHAGTANGFARLFFANLAFFALTQGIEGVPIATGSIVLGIVLAAVGSLLAAFIVGGFARTIACVIDEALALAAHPRALAWTPRTSAAARTAARTYTLFVPNRPPPAPSLV